MKIEKDNIVWSFLYRTKDNTFDEKLWKYVYFIVSHSYISKFSKFHIKVECIYGQDIFSNAKHNELRYVTL